ncbi:MAG: alpha/beta fold hydrolase, partial [Primorskyibacter sp.]
MPYVTTTDGLSLYYTDTGSGIPVLCLSGLTRDHRDFSYVAPYLAPPNRDGLRMICMDYRGRGKSDWTDPATYTIPQEAQDAVTLMDHLGIDKAAILGTSRGGLIAMGLAAGARDRLLGVALND